LRRVGRMGHMKGREIGEEEFEELKNGLDRHIDIEGVDSSLVNIPTVMTGINDDGTLREEIIEPYAYEVNQKNKRFMH
jgi:hypothetical protein